jgi:hypothetical protein
MTFYGSLKSMNVEQKMLFGIHDLESARHALIAAGSLLKERKNIGVTLFHGSPDADLSTVAKLLRLTPEVVEEYRKVCSMQEGEVLEYAKDLLAESGIDPARLATICTQRAIVGADAHGAGHLSGGPDGRVADYLVNRPPRYFSRCFGGFGGSAH